MKIYKLAALLVFLFSLSGFSVADDRYESTYGNTYQYDMSDPSDRIDYSVDIDAQMRDKSSIEPTRELDQKMGEHGGGIYEY